MRIVKGFVMVVMLIVVWTVAEGESQAMSDRELAEHWAPEFYQDVNDRYGWKADMITRFDYDGDWKADNNWDNLYNHPLESYIYYSVVESETHYFIGYYAFHPRDDGPVAEDRHPNDMEGVLLTIRKDGSAYGTFQYMETFAHHLFYQYAHDSSITKGQADIDGNVRFAGHRPQVYIQPNGASNTLDNGNYGGGHGMYAYSGQGVTDAGIVYEYTGQPSVVSSEPEGVWQQRTSYDLLSLDALYDRRENTQTYPDFDRAPWGWDMHYYSDGETFRGDWLADPAHFVDTHVDGLGDFSHTYVSNPYATHVVTIHDVTSLHDGDWTTGSDVFVRFKVDGVRYSGYKLWRYYDAPKGTPVDVYWGKDHAGDGDAYSEPYQKRYIVRPQNAPIRIEIVDHDETGSDSMGHKQTTLSPGNSVQWNDVLTNSGRARFSAEIEAIGQ